MQKGRKLNLKTDEEIQLFSVTNKKTLEDNKFGAEYTRNQDVELPKGADQYENEKGDIVNVEGGKARHSEFSNYHLLKVKSVDGKNYPLTDEELAQRPELIQETTARDLISKQVGASVFREKDFIFNDLHNKVSLDHMITLRRFAFPVFDDIYSSFQTEPDIARMVTYQTQDLNTNAEVMTFRAGLRWKELKSTIEPMSMQGSDREGVSSHMRSVLKYIDPTFAQNALAGENKLNLNPLHDSNKVYGLVDSIDSTHIRGRGINFEQDISLKFSYYVQSYNGINQKAAFIDLLGSILVMITNHAKFWGGARFWLGAKPTKYLKNLKFMSPTSFDDFLNKSHVEFKSVVSNFSGGGGSDNAKEQLKQIASNALGLSLGKMLKTIGRPSIPYTNSLLTGNPVGMWHVTIGNPMNPRMCIGNMLCTGGTVTFGEELGIDGFPERIDVNITLKHAMPRGLAEIESMFNAGRGRFYMKPKDFMKVGEQTTKTKAGHVQSLINDGIDRAWGNFSKSAILNNKDEVWAFLKK